MKDKIDYFSQNKVSLLSLFITAIIVFIAGQAGANPFYTIADTNSFNYMAFAENQSVIVTIPKCAANPEVDITKLTPTQWYIPPKISLNQNHSVTWINKNTEIHTVTSGNGAGLESLMNNKQGTKSGIFDSGIFKPGGNWTHMFEKAGTFAYFCTVHPWMEGTVVVKKVTSLPIPNYPVDASEQRQKVIPVHTLTKDNKYDIDMAWNPIPTYRTASVFYFGFLRPSH